LAFRVMGFKIRGLGWFRLQATHVPVLMFNSAKVMKPRTTSKAQVLNRVCIV
jgi:hypothetical protein